MGLFRRTQVLGKRSMNGASREIDGRALLEAAARRRVELGPPTPIADAVLTAATSTVGVEAGSPLHRALVDAVLLGYACRARGASDAVPEPARIAIAAHLVRDAEGRLDYGPLIDIPDAVHALARTATSLAASGPTGAAAAGVNEATWETCCAAGASDLRAQLLIGGLPDQPVLATDFLALMIRLGIVLRLIEEVAGESPTPRTPDLGAGSLSGRRENGR
jgi:hypothetical protein